MKRIGLEKARSRLSDAFRAFESLKSAQDWNELSSAWTRLLVAVNATYVILGSSAKGNAKSEGWYSKVVGQQRSDELLSYMMHARNANEHGIAEVLQLKPPGMSVGSDVRGMSIYIKHAAIGPTGFTRLEGWQEDGSPLVVKRHPARAILVPVVDRGIEYQPPRNFLGELIADASPVGIAAQVIEFMVLLFVDAEELVAMS
jgi:hypothetical protein